MYHLHWNYSVFFFMSSLVRRHQLIWDQYNSYPNLFHDMVIRGEQENHHWKKNSININFSSNSKGQVKPSRPPPPGFFSISVLASPLLWFLVFSSFKVQSLEKKQRYLPIFKGILSLFCSIPFLNLHFPFGQSHGNYLLKALKPIKLKLSSSSSIAIHSAGLVTFPFYLVLYLFIY